MCCLAQQRDFADLELSQGLQDWKVNVQFSYRPNVTIRVLKRGKHQTESLEDVTLLAFKREERARAQEGRNLQKLGRPGNRLSPMASRRTQLC